MVFVIKVAVPNLAKTDPYMLAATARNMIMADVWRVLRDAAFKVSQVSRL